VLVNRGLSHYERVAVTKAEQPRGGMRLRDRFADLGLLRGGDVEELEEVVVAIGT
jgi:hypothetical protein